MGTRKEVPPPYDFLMTRGGGGEVKTRQVEPGGGWRSEGGREFFFLEARRDFHIQLDVARCMGRPRHLHIHWRRLRAAQWTPTKDWISLLWVGPG